MTLYLFSFFLPMNSNKISITAVNIKKAAEKMGFEKKVSIKSLKRYPVTAAGMEAIIICNANLKPESSLYFLIKSPKKKFFIINQASLYNTVSKAVRVAKCKVTVKYIEGSCHLKKYGKITR